MLPIWIRLYRLVFGIIALTAVTWSYFDSDDPYFWRFFTNQSGLLAGLVLVFGAVVWAKFRNPQWWDVARGIAVISMLLTGVVYAALLDGLYNPFTTTEHTWAASVLHQLMPIVMSLDILIIPLGHRTKRWTALLYPLYPLVYLGISLDYGDRNGWYPYDFIDPTTYDNGYVGVSTTCAALLVAFIIIGLGIITYSRWRMIPAKVEA